MRPALAPGGRPASRAPRGAWSAALALALGAAAVPAPSPASGQALPFHTTTGITAGFQENAARTFVSFLGRSGLVRDGETVADPRDRDVDAFSVPTGVIPVSFGPLWTARVVVPWVDKSMAFTDPHGRRRSFDTSGVGDALIDTKWIFYSDNRPRASTRIGLQGGVKVPLGETDARLPNGEVAPRPLQVGTGSVDFPVKLIFTDVEDRWGFHANAGWRLNTGDDGFEAGDVFGYDTAVGFRLLPATFESLRDQTVVAYLELNGQVARENETDGVENPDSGGHTLFLSPQLQWIPTPWLLFEGSVQVPVVQDLNGTQLEHETRFQIGSRFRFSVFR